MVLSARVYRHGQQAISGGERLLLHAFVLGLLVISALAAAAL